MNNIYRFTILFILLLCSEIGITQTENVFGIVNRYAAVTNLDQCEGVVEVANSAGFNEGDRVLIIQMQGANINETNTAVFGTLDSVQNINGAGLYEKNRIVAIDGNTISLQFALLNNYEIEGKVQLVSIPVYQNAVVNTTLDAKSWDGNTGGIVALEVNNRLTVNGRIDADGRGFRGGRANNTQIDSCASTAFLGPITSFYNTFGNWRGAQKGEGIAAYIDGKEAGRGPQINGGGGANTHQSGGGGGAHHTPGGSGGELESLGTCKGLFPGTGGINLEDTSDRIFFGGGGGGGHGFNAGTNGGNGGGIVILTAREIAGGGVISANGDNAVQATQEGAGGGGAGGSILLEISTALFNANLDLEVKGGNGGNTDSQGDPRCFGPGGGGSGGRIYTTLGANLSAVRAGGNVGRILNAESACNGTSNSATAGGPGVVKIFQGIKESNIALADGPDIALCGPSTGSSVQFFVNDIGVEYYEYFTIINDGLPSEIDTTTSNFIEVDGLNAGDAVALIISGVGGVCSTVADTVFCFANNCEGVVLQAETNIESLYCLDTFPRPLTATPSGGVFLGPGVNIEGTFTPTIAGLGEHELFYQYTDEDGCVRLDSYLTEVITSPEPPEIICSNSDEGSVEFIWTHPSSTFFRVSTTINGVPMGLPLFTSENVFLQDNLRSGDIVSISVIAVNQDCGDSEVATSICVAQACAEGSVNINPPAITTYCNEDAAFQIVAEPSGGTFLGTGVNETGFFDPSTVLVPADSSSLTVDVVYSLSEVEGCPPTLDTLQLEVLARPAPPIIECGNNSINSIEFLFTQPLVNTFELTYSINGGAFQMETFTGNSFIVDGLEADDMIELTAVVVDVNGCGQSDVASISCVANPCPIIEPELTGLDIEYCQNAEPVQLSAIPIGGIFRGDGVSNTGLFDPSLANLGTNIIQYAFTTEEGCVYGDTLMVEIFEPQVAPVLTCNSTSTSIEFFWISDAETFEYTTSINGGASSAVQTTTDSRFVLSELASGDVVEFSIKAIGNAVCGDSQFAVTTCQTSICTTEPPIIQNLSDVYCTTDPNIELEATPTGGTFTVNGTNATILSPSTLGEGLYQISYSITDELGCEQVQNTNVEIVGVPAMPVVSCGDSTSQSVTFEFDNPENDFFIYTIAVNGQSLLLDTTNQNSINFGGLDMMDEVELSIAPLDVFICNNVEQSTQVCLPIQCAETDALVDIAPFYCFDTTAIQIFAEPSGGIFNGNGISQAGLFTPSDVVEGPTTITYAFTDANGCEQIDTFTTEVIPLPIAPILDCADKTNSTATFVWTHPEEGTRFQYSLSVNGGDFTTPIVTTDTSFTQTGLSPGTTVTIRVASLSETACGVSETVSFTCTTEDCPNLFAPVASCGLATPNSVEFTWTHPDEGTQFQYSVSVNGGAFSEETITTENSFIQTALSENDEVTLRIIALGQLGCPNSPSVEFSCAAAACPDVDIFLNPIETLCLGLDDEPIDLIANFTDNIDVETAVWSGLGVVGNTFDPSTPSLSEGTITLTFTLTSFEGCTYEATTEVELQTCGDAALTGSIFTEEGRGVNTVVVELLGELPQTAQTDVNGNYAFESVESGRGYSLQLSREDFTLNGVSVFDMVLIQKHILNTELLSSPYKILAADVNGSNSVTVSDLVALRRALLNIEPNFPVAENWRFVPTRFVFPDPTNPWSTPIPDASDSFDILGLTERNFIAIKLGDVNGSAFVD